MRLKARGLVQYHTPTGLQEESDPVGCDIVCTGQNIPPALTDHTTCPDLRLISKCTLNTIIAMSFKDSRKAWPGTRRPRPSLWSLLYLQIVTIFALLFWSSQVKGFSYVTDIPELNNLSGF